LLALSPYKTKAWGQSQDDDQQGMTDQQDNQHGAYDRQQPQDDQYGNTDDSYGDNDEQEAEGRNAPPPPSDRVEMDQPRPSQSSEDESQPDQAQAEQPQPGQPRPSEPGPSANDNAPDVPARAARLQFMTGSISIQPRGAGDWATGELNRPLTNADNVWADKNSRAELNVGTGLIRIDSESSLTLANIDENSVQLQLHQGAMIVHVRRLYDNEVWEVDTPNQAFTVSKPGDYRFDVDPNADTTVITVWSGEGKSTGNGPALVVHQNEQVRFTGESMASEIHAAPRPDAFDQWASSRDQRIESSQSARYVSPDVPGSEDLDEYGTWSETPDYGPVWVPRHVEVGWAPYRYGHWIWVAPWGWTWVEDEPWGYAPFHYGRWVYWGGSWGWAPGPVYARPYYAPALVAWFGGAGWGVNVGFGGGFGYGWCPLGFGEPYVPWYHVSRGYFNRVNITNTRITNVRITNVYNNTYVHNTYGHNGGSPGRPGGGGPYGPHSGAASMHYANMRAPNGFTAVSRNTLVNGQQVARNELRVSPNQMSRMTPVHSLNARPSRSAVMGGARAAVTPPSRSFSRPTIARNSAPGAGREGFGRPGPAMGNNRSASAVYGGREPMGSRSIPRSSPGSSAGVDRPQMGSVRGNNGGGMQSGRPDFGNRGAQTNMRSSPRSEMSVPRPPNASRDYSGGERSQGSYQANRAPIGSGYGRPAANGDSYDRRAPAYDRGSMGRPMPSNGGGAYGRPMPSNERGAYGRPMPSNGGGPYGRSMPSYSSPRSMPSYGGRGAYGGRPSNGGGGMPSRGASGGGRPSGGFGGGHASGAGRASMGGGGGHSGGGSHGGGGRH
jgi:hypothetical protein